MYLHLGRGNIVRTEDILAITDFERLTSFKRGQDYIEEFLKREDIDNPKGQIFPQSCVFVLKGIDEEEEKEEKIKSLKDLSKEELSKMSIIEKSLFDLQMRKNEEKRKSIIKEVDMFLPPQ